MRKTNKLLLTAIGLLIIFIILLSIYMKSTAQAELKASHDRRELLDLNIEQIRLLKAQNETN